MNGWYTGIHYIHHLKFFNCSFNNVLLNAFNATAFNHLRSITFTAHQALLAFQNGCFRGLNKLEVLFFRFTTIAYIHGTFLEDICKNIKTIRLTQLINNIGIADIFGGARYPKQLTVVIEDVESSKFETLASANFTKFTTIQYLDIINSGVKFILAGSFDPISASLEGINLSRNKIKHLQPALYRFLFEKMCFTYKNFVVLNFHENKLKCSCDFIFLKSVKRAMVHSENDKNDFICTSENKIQDDDCTGFQRTNISKLCPMIYKKSTIILYIQFRIKFDETIDSLLLHGKTNHSLRIVLVTLKQRQFCPLDRSDSANIKCFKVSANNVVIPYSMMPQSTFIKVSIIYYIHGWPLSTITIRLPKLNNILWFSLNLHIILPVIGFLFGFSAYVCKMIFRNSESTQNLPETTSVIA